MRSAALFLFGLLLRLWLIGAFPIVFGGDTILRLANRDHILLSYQLPVLQALVYSVSRAGGGLLEIRWVLAACGAAAGVCFYLMARAMAGEKAALGAALLFTANPFLVELSIVPYQEVIMLGATCLSFALFLRNQNGAASLALGIACLTRYEAWIAAPVLAAARGRRALLRSCLLFGWAPLAWMLFHLGVSAPGTFVIEWPRSPMRLMRWAYLAWITVKNTPPPVLALAALGAVHIWRSRLYRRREVAMPAAFGALFLLAILFSAHGVSPDPERYVASREAAFPIAGILALAAFGLAWGLDSRPRAVAVWTLAGLGLVWSLFDAYRFLRRDTSEPHLQLSYQLARYLDGVVRPGERIRLVVAPTPPELLDAYLAKVKQRQGEAGLERARQVMAGMDVSPPDCQRTWVHSRLERSRFICAQSDTVQGDADWLAAWSDAPTAGPQPGPPLAVLRAGSFSVSIYGPKRPAP